MTRNLVQRCRIRALDQHLELAACGHVQIAARAADRHDDADQPVDLCRRWAIGQCHAGRPAVAKDQRAFAPRSLGRVLLPDLFGHERHDGMEHV